MYYNFLPFAMLNIQIRFSRILLGISILFQSIERLTIHSLPCMCVQYYTFMTHFNISNNIVYKPLKHKSVISD